MKEFKVGDIVKYNGGREVYFKLNAEYTVTEVNKTLDGIGISGYGGLWNPDYFTLVPEVKPLTLEQLKEAKKKLESEILNFVSSRVAEFQKFNNVEIEDVIVAGAHDFTEWIPSSATVRIEI